MTFYPNNFDKTYNAIISKFTELYQTIAYHKSELRDIDVQLNEIYKDYEKNRDKHQVSDAEHLVYLAKSHIKQQFRDQTGAFYAVIEKDGHDELFNMDSDEFDMYSAGYILNLKLKTKSYMVILSITRKGY